MRTRTLSIDEFYRAVQKNFFDELHEKPRRELVEIPPDALVATYFKQQGLPLKPFGVLKGREPELDKSSSTLWVYLDSPGNPTLTVAGRVPLMPDNFSWSLGFDVGSLRWGAVQGCIGYPVKGVDQHQLEKTLEDLRNYVAALGKSIVQREGQLEESLRKTAAAMVAKAQSQAEEEAGVAKTLGIKITGG